jgi:RNA polymerase sigma-70 factor (ECF subfamily)
MGGTPDFRTTHWSVVLMAGRDDSTQATAALEKLCRTYWYPIYSFLRWRGYDSHDAEDLTQGFFAQLLQRNDFISVDAAKGKFRSFLLGALSHFLANEWDRSQRLKRGGGQSVISLDAQSAEERYKLEPATQETPEQIFERRWIEALLETVLLRLRGECAAQGQANRFDALKVFLVEDKGAASFAEIGRGLNMTEPAVKGVVRRLRSRYRELFREEVANTVDKPEELDEEIQQLLAVLSK